MSTAGSKMAPLRAAATALPGDTYCCSLSGLRLIMMRHGESESAGEVQDHARHLTQDGIAEAKQVQSYRGNSPCELHSSGLTEGSLQIALRLEQSGWLPDLILCSTAQRTMQTLEAMQGRCAALRGRAGPSVSASIHVCSDGRHDTETPEGGRSCTWPHHSVEHLIRPSALAGLGTGGGRPGQAVHTLSGAQQGVGGGGHHACGGQMLPLLVLLVLLNSEWPTDALSVQGQPVRLETAQCSIAARRGG